MVYCRALCDCMVALVHWQCPKIKHTVLGDDDDDDDIQTLTTDPGQGGFQNTVYWFVEKVPLHAGRGVCV
ncbi:unnamed protein product [Boreogadus saida]